MPIINLCKATDEGAEGHMSGYGGYSHSIREENTFVSCEFQGPAAYWTRLSHIGLCIKDFERNGYDDSDFMMVVWSWEKQEPETICFASTRGWSYPCYASYADATPEVIEAYKAWGVRMVAVHKAAARKAEAKTLRHTRAIMLKASNDHGISYARLLKFRRTNPTKTNAVLWLLTANIRSGFKLSMRNQVIAWFSDPAPRYATPLSAKQFEYIPTK